MATHSTILARKIPWAKEPGRLQSGGEGDVTKESDPIEHASSREKIRIYMIAIFVVIW